MLTVIDQHARHPPNGWTYTDPDDGHVTNHIILDEAYKMAVKYRRVNHYPVPGDFRAQFEDQVCKGVPAGFCHEETGAQTQTGNSPIPRKTKQIGFTEMVSGSKFLVKWLMGGTYEPDEEIMRRIAICADCDDNVPVFGQCSTCGGASAALSIMEKVIAKKAFAGDEKLKACYHCGCSNKAQVRVKLSMLHEHIPDRLNAQLPDHCWKKRK